jgi:hypothetical protein
MLHAFALLLVAQQQSPANSGGTPGWVTAVIAAFAAVVAASATAAASAYAARRKVVEIELAHAHQLEAEYLQSARQYSQDVYLPLARAVNGFDTAFNRFRASTGEVSAALIAWRNHCEAFLQLCDDLFERGASAALTIRLDNSLSSFISFICESLTATEARIVNQVVFDVGFGLLGIRSGFHRTRTTAAVLPNSLIQSSSLLNVLGLRLEVNQHPTLIAAPLESSEFEERFVTDIGAIKIMIKEVTLGGFVTRAK